MRSKKITLPDGRDVDGQILSFQTGGEHWNEYLVDDNTVIRVKLVATEIVRLEGEYDVEGNPVYLLQSTNVMAVESPEGLKRKD